MVMKLIIAMTIKMISLKMMMITMMMMMMMMVLAKGQFLLHGATR